MPKIGTDVEKLSTQIPADELPPVPRYFPYDGAPEYAGTARSEGTFRKLGVR
jgi:hypothetical protein